MTPINLNYDSISYSLYCHNDLIKNIILKTGTYFEEWLLTPLKEKVDSFDFVIDIGSNIGNHSHFFKNICNAKHVICFEPLPENFELLEKNCPTCTLYKKGISSYNGTGYLTHSDGVNNNSGTAKMGNSGLEIEVNTLDNFDFENVTFIKIDVEGHELEVLKGSINTIKKYKPNILVETHSGISPENVAELLPQGYIFEQLGHEPHYLYKFKK